MPTTRSCPTSPLYPKPGTPSSLAWLGVWSKLSPEVLRTPSVLAGKQSTKVNQAFGHASSSSIVNPHSILYSKALCRLLWIVQHHHSILHHGHHPLWLWIWISVFSEEPSSLLPLSSSDVWYMYNPPYAFHGKLDGVGPVDNRPSTDVHRCPPMFFFCLLTKWWCLWNMTWDMWHMTCCGGWTFPKNFSSLALTVCDLWYYKDLEEKDRWLTEWNNQWRRCL